MISVKFIENSDPQYTYIEILSRIANQQKAVPEHFDADDQIGQRHGLVQ
jgi:hypothetical protein